MFKKRKDRKTLSIQLTFSLTMPINPLTDLSLKINVRTLMLIIREKTRLSPSFLSLSLYPSPSLLRFFHVSLSFLQAVYHSLKIAARPLLCYTLNKRKQHPLRLFMRSTYLQSDQLKGLFIASHVTECNQCTRTLQTPRTVCRYLFRYVLWII